MRKIESLTTEQEAALSAYRDEWLRHGRSTEPADRATAEAAIRAMYAAIGEPEPYVWWCDGPAIGSVIRAVLRDNLRANLGGNLGANLGGNLGGNLGANLRANLGDNLRDNLGDNLRANLRDNLRDNLWDNLWANLGDNLRDNLGGNLGANLGANLGGNLGANLRANLGWHFWGQHEAYWPAYYAWPDTELRSMYSAQDRERLGWWLDLSRSCGWWEPYRGVVFVCERPLVQAVDDEGRLHREDGPAMVCRDGWCVWAIHNVRVPQQVVEAPDTLTVEQIRGESNAEVRRVMIERFGQERYLHESGAVKIHEDEWGTLYRADVPDDEPIVMVEVVNSTPEPDGHFKDYWLRVPPHITTAREAVAWTFDVPTDEYAPLVET